MSESREKLIADLVADLRPVHRPGRVDRLTAAWLSVAVLYSVALLVVTGPFRDGALRSLLAHPAFAAETAAAAVAVTVLAVAAFSSGVPGAAKRWRTLSWPVLTLGVWLSFYVVGAAGYPAHPVSELGHRDHCFLQSQLIALPNVGLLLWLARRLAVLRPRLTGVLAGAAAAAIPGAMMQFACMYSPDHILLYHVGPVLVTGSVGALLAPALLKRRDVVPRRRTQTLH